MERIDKIQEIVEPVIEGEGFELVDLEYKKEGGAWVLRVFIDNPQGISHTECKKISNILSPILDIEAPIDHSYILEVSSPGLDRPLKKEEDFERFAGQKIVIKTRVAFDGRKTFKGNLLGLIEGKIRVELEDGDTISIPKDIIEKVNLEVEI